jgi:membrane-bound lytic murein transglycosylase A
MIAGATLLHGRYGRIAVTALGLLGAAASSHVAHAKEQRLVKIPKAQFAPITWTMLEGWAEDDHAAAFAAFMVSCRTILKGSPGKNGSRPMFGALREVCGQAAELKQPDAKTAREFFEQNFRPVRISPIGETDGFITGYYEPVVDGRLEPDDDFIHPLYRKPGNLLRGGRMLGAARVADKKKSKGKASAKRRLIPYHDRAAIENGVLNGRNLEICYLKDPVDAFFIHIQGSVRVKLKDGKLLRLNYEAANGQPYTPVGKFLIERNIYTREEMSMEKIREWMNANPEEGHKLRLRNKSYVFFRETGLGQSEEPIGAQGVSLTPGRSIAVDRNLHVYGTPFFIQAELPIESEAPTTPFRRLMIAQDTGGAIVGPARADIYWGAGVEAGVISGRFKQPGKFVMLFPNALYPAVEQREVPLPKPRPASLPVAAKSDDKPATSKKPVAATKQVEPGKAAESKKPAEVKKPAQAQAPAAKKQAETRKTTEAKKPAAAPKPVATKKQADTKKPAETTKPNPKKKSKPQKLPVQTEINLHSPT